MVLAARAHPGRRGCAAVGALARQGESGEAPSSLAASVRSFAVSMARQYAPCGSGNPASRRSRASRGNVVRSWSPRSGSSVVNSGVKT